jgi:hypothetical protein
MRKPEAANPPGTPPGEQPKLNPQPGPPERPPCWPPNWPWPPVLQGQPGVRPSPEFFACAVTLLGMGMSLEEAILLCMEWTTAKAGSAGGGGAASAPTVAQPPSGFATGSIRAEHTLFQCKEALLTEIPAEVCVRITTPRTAAVDSMRPASWTSSRTDRWSARSTGTAPRQFADRLP